jgi:hypothetical protein
MEGTMGIICDLVIANEGAAEAIITAESRFDAFRVFPTKLLDPVTLDGLFALLDPESPGLGVWWDAPLAERDEQIVCQLPPALTARLASLTPGQRHDLAWRWWQQSEELALAYRYTRLSPDAIAANILSLVDEVCAFLREAVDAGQRVYLFMSP